MIKPKRLKLKQNTPEWLDWRRSHIGGSDSNVIMAYFKKIPLPWRDNVRQKLHDLWREKTGKDGIYQRVPNFAMAHGIKTEPIARQLYCETVGEFAPPACFERGFMATSLDGWIARLKKPVEIKCPTKEEYHSPPGMVPQHYVAQCFHNLYVSGAEELDFVSYWKGQISIATLQPQSEYLAELIDAETKFWTWVLQNRFPDEPKLLLKVDEDGSPDYSAYEKLKKLL